MNENTEKCRKIRMKNRIHHALSTTSIISILIEIISCIITIFFYNKGYISETSVSSFILRLSGVVAIVSFISLFLLSMTTKEEKLHAKSTRSNHGDDLVTVMESIRREPLEYRAIFDEHGNKLAEGTLCLPNMSNLVLFDQWLIGSASIDLHNHPSSYELSFSEQDIKGMITNLTCQNIVVTRNYTYIMENPYWEDGEYPFDESDFNAFVHDKWQISLFTRILHLFPTFVRWHSIYISYSVARRFGLKFYVQNHRLERFKRALWIHG